MAFFNNSANINLLVIRISLDRVAASAYNDGSKKTAGPLLAQQTSLATNRDTLSQCGWQL